MIAVEKDLATNRPWRYQPAPAPSGWWQGVTGTERAQAATRQLLEELGWGELDPSVVAGRLSKRAFRDHGLGGMLNIVYSDSPYAALADLYPELRPWQMGKASD